MIKEKYARPYIKGLKLYPVKLIISLLLGIFSLAAHADGTSPCNVGSGEFSTECGATSLALGDFASAVGYSASASGEASTAVGLGTRSTGAESTALGTSTSATGDSSSALGRSAHAESTNSTSVGAYAGFNGGVDVTNSPASIAIGYRSNITALSPGAIAIGSDLFNGDNLGAQASGINAIALGTDALASQSNGIAIGAGAKANGLKSVAIGAGTVANTANTIVAGYPLTVTDPNLMAATRNLLKLSNVGPVGFRFEDSATNDAWIFRQTIDRGFTMDALNTPGLQEVKFFEGGNMKILGTLTQGSSRTNKKNIQAIKAQSVLDRLSTLPIHQWTYKHEDERVKHIGPMAEDFYKAFKLGTTPKGISSLDSSGVALAAIQALSIKLDEKDQRIARLELQLARMDARLNNLIENGDVTRF